MPHALRVGQANNQTWRCSHAVPRNWAARAAIGAALLAVGLPLLLSTGTDLGLRPAPLLLQASLVAEALVVAFAAILLLVPTSVWRLVWRYSDVQHSLSLQGTVCFYGVDAHNRNEASATCRLTMHNGGPSAVRYFIETCDLEMGGPSAVQSFPVLGGVLVSGGTQNVTCTNKGIDASIDHLEGWLNWSVLCGPANGKLEVRWTRAVGISFDRGGVGGSMTSHFADIASDKYALIKPTDKPPA